MGVHREQRGVRVIMNVEQTKAVRMLKKALDACHLAGLRGGTIEGCYFGVWPRSVDIEAMARDTGKCLGNTIESCGGAIISTQMVLDGLTN